MQQGWKSGGTLSINLSAICQNWRFFNALSSAKAAAILKANAYGLGATKIAPTLYKEGARHFFVANPYEAEEISALLPNEKEIFILCGLSQEEFDLAIERKFTPILHEITQVNAWLKFCRHKNLKAPYALQIDTGMNRLGLSLKEYKEFLPSSDFLDHPPTLILSHFACADILDHPLTTQQINQFTEIKLITPFSCRFSLANSAGALLGSKTHYDILRPGCGVYGLNPRFPFPKPPEIQNTVTLQANILQIKTLRAGDSIGYGASYTAKRHKKIALIDIGYADGYLRSGSNQGFVKIGTNLCPLIGRISMDLSAVDISSISECEIPNLSTVSIFGDHYTVDDHAKNCGTIGYELLTALGNRYHRCYIQT